MRTRFFKRDFDLPALDEPLQDLHGRDTLVRAQKRLWLEPAGRIAYQDPTQRHWRFATVIPERSTAGDIELLSLMTIPVAQRDALPLCGRRIEHITQCALTRALHGR